MGYDVDALSLARAYPVSGLGSAAALHVSTHFNVWSCALEPRASERVGKLHTRHESSLSWLV
jgi:hypothetical protein